MIISPVRQAIRPPLTQLIFSPKIDYFTVGAPRGSKLPALQGRVRWHGGSSGYTVHDATPADVRALAGLPLRELEIAVDVRPKASIQGATREQLLEQVMLGIFAKGLSPQHDGCQPYFRGAWWSGSMRPFNKRLPPPRTSMVFGHKEHESWQTKAYFKTIDMCVELPVKELAARVEVTLKLEQLDLHGLHHVGDLIGFSLRRELSSYFRHVEGLEPRALRRRPKSELHRLLVSKQAELLNAEFDRVGVGCASRGGKHEGIDVRTIADKAVNDRIGQALGRLEAALSS